MIKRSSSIGEQRLPPGSTVQRSRAACVLCFTDERPARCGTKGQDSGRASARAVTLRALPHSLNPPPLPQPTTEYLDCHLFVLYVLLHITNRSDGRERGGEGELFRSPRISQQTKSNEGL